MKAHASGDDADIKADRVERVVLDPGDPVLRALKTRFDRGALPWALYCGLWELRIRRLRRRLNPGRRTLTGTSWSSLLRSDRVPRDAVPVLINNFNRLDTLKIQIGWLKSLTRRVWIIILDNASEYPPLLSFYNQLESDPEVHVVRLGYNSGMEGLQKAVSSLAEIPYLVVTDPDLIPYPSTPLDILDRMQAALEAFPEIGMVGASLEIADIPEYYPLRDRVQDWESRFWPPAAEALGDYGFRAWVDTTFAMYRQGVDVLDIEPAMRLDRPYVLKHVDWYVAPGQLSDEQLFYARVSQPIASWTARLRKEGS